jgi:integrase/recombinase XerD
MATARIILDTRKAKSDGTFPVKIRIAHVKDHQRLNVKVSLTEEDFNKVIKGKNLNETLKPLKIKLDERLTKANNIIKDLHPFSFDAFNSAFNQIGNRADLLFLLSNKAESLREDDKHGNANLYQQSATLLARYNATLKKKDNVLLITDITPNWLQGFEKWALKLKRTTGKGDVISEYGKTTLGMYLIRVRAIFNEAITNNELNRNYYPFHKADNQRGYKIPKGTNNKRALSIAEIMVIYNYVPISPNEQFAKDMFLFSYLSSGMNAVDIFRLKWSDISGNHFSFVRKKTENKVGGTNKITINLSDDLLAIIERHGTRKLNTNYIFNVIPANTNEKELLQKVRTSIASINVYLKKIAVKVGVTSEISTYFARHSYATAQMGSEVPLAFISKQLGHTDLKTTQNYLDSFPSEKSAEYQSNLLDKTKLA